MRYFFIGNKPEKRPRQDKLVMKKTLEALTGFARTPITRGIINHTIG